jgi:hypothetical protein
VASSPRRHRGIKRAARRSDEFLLRLAARSRALCASRELAQNWGQEKSNRFAHGSETRRVPSHPATPPTVPCSLLAIGATKISTKHLYPLTAGV